MKTKDNLVNNIDHIKQKILGIRFIIPMFLTMSLSAIFALIASIVYIIGKSQYIPYVVTVDKEGVVITKSNIKKLDNIPKQYIASELCQFIKNTREVLKDKELQEEAIFKSYSFINNEHMTSKLDKHFIENNPFTSAKNKNVYITINNIIEKSSHSYEIDFTENHVAKFQEDKKVKYRALITYKTINVDLLSSKEILLNPLGIIVEDIFISEYMGA